MIGYGKIKNCPRISYGINTMRSGWFKWKEYYGYHRDRVSDYINDNKLYLERFEIIREERFGGKSYYMIRFSNGLKSVIDQKDVIVIPCILSDELFEL